MSKTKENSLNIMIVEDDKIFVKLHAHVIKRETNIEPTAFMDAEEALEYLDNNANEDVKFLIFLDLNMPGMDGWEFMEICQEKPYSRKISIVIVTSSIYNADKKRSESYNQVIGYISKPLKNENIRETMEKFSSQEFTINGFHSIENNNE